MKRFSLLLCAFLFAAQASAQIKEFGGGPMSVMPGDDNEADIERQLLVAKENARKLRIENIEPRVSATGNLDFPLRLRPNSKAFRGNGISNFVDLDPTAKIKEFACGTRTYDGHRGSDLSLFPYSWRMMDAMEVEIVAAAPGVILNKGDGQNDRQCVWGNNPPANFVIVHQDDGLNALYWHMKKGSVTKQPVGARVAAGDVLGLVGSSGFSTGPHLHFELRARGDQTVDPWQGMCGTSVRTHWRHQPETVDSDVLRIATHSAMPPGVPDSCSNPNPHYADVFKPGAVIWGAVYLRDQRSGIKISFVRPNGKIFSTSNIPKASYNFSYWWLSATLPTTGATGVWTLRVEMDHKTMERAFIVGPAARPTALGLTRTPAAATLTAGTEAQFTVTVRNTGTREAVGCTVVPDAPLAAVWNVQQIKPSLPASEANYVFSLAPSTAKTFRLSIKPKTGYKADALTIPLRASCLNANSPATADTNEIKLTF